MELAQKNLKRRLLNNAWCVAISRIGGKTSIRLFITASASRTSVVSEAETHPSNEWDDLFLVINIKNNRSSLTFHPGMKIQ